MRPRALMCTQLYPTLCHPMDCSPPGSSVHGLFQAKMLEWIALSYSRGFSRSRKIPDSGSNSHLLLWQADSLPVVPPARRAWQPTPVFLPGETHGQRSLAGYSPRVAKSQTWLKRLSTHASAQTRNKAHTAFRSIPFLICGSRMVRTFQSVS